MKLFLVAFFASFISLSTSVTIKLTRPGNNPNDGITCANIPAATCCRTIRGTFGYIFQRALITGLTDRDMGTLYGFNNNGDHGCNSAPIRHGMGPAPLAVYVDFANLHGATTPVAGLWIQCTQEPLLFQITRLCFMKFKVKRALAKWSGGLYGRAELPSMEPTEARFNGTTYSRQADGEYRDDAGNLIDWAEFWT